MEYLIFGFVEHVCSPLFLFTLADFHLQQKVQMKVCVCKNTNRFRRICSKGTLTRPCVTSIRMNTELWYVDNRVGRSHSEG